MLRSIWARLGGRLKKQAPGLGLDQRFESEISRRLADYRVMDETSSLLSNELDRLERKVRERLRDLSRLEAPTQVLRSNVFRVRQQIHDFLEPTSGGYMRALAQWPPVTSPRRRALIFACEELNRLNERGNEALGSARHIADAKLVLASLASYANTQPELWNKLIRERTLPDRLEETLESAAAEALLDETRTIAQTLTRREHALMSFGRGVDNPLDFASVSEAVLEIQARSTALLESERAALATRESRGRLHIAATRHLQHLGAKARRPGRASRPVASDISVDLEFVTSLRSVAQSAKTRPGRKRR